MSDFTFQKLRRLQYFFPVLSSRYKQQKTTTKGVTSSRNIKCKSEKVLVACFLFLQWQFAPMLAINIIASRLGVCLGVMKLSTTSAKNENSEQNVKIFRRAWC